MINRKNIIIIVIMAIMLLGSVVLSAAGTDVRRAIDISGKAEWVSGEGLIGTVKVELFYNNTPGEVFEVDIIPSTRTYSIVESVTDAYTNLRISCTITEGHCCTNPTITRNYSMPQIGGIPFILSNENFIYHHVEITKP